MEDTQSGKEGRGGSAVMENVELGKPLGTARLGGASTKDEAEYDYDLRARLD